MSGRSPVEIVQLGEHRGKLSCARRATAGAAEETWLKPVIRLGILGVIVLVGVFVADPFTASSAEVGACLKGDVNDADSIENAECGGLLPDKQVLCLDDLKKWFSAGGRSSAGGRR